MSTQPFSSWHVTSHFLEDLKTSVFTGWIWTHSSNEYLTKVKLGLVLARLLLKDCVDACVELEIRKLLCKLLLCKKMMSHLPHLKLQILKQRHAEMRQVVRREPVPNTDSLNAVPKALRLSPNTQAWHRQRERRSLVPRLNGSSSATSSSSVSNKRLPV